MHCKALGLKERRDGGKVEFVGVEPEYMREGNGMWDEGKAEKVREGEKVRGWGAWVGDLYGRGEVLV